MNGVPSSRLDAFVCRANDVIWLKLVEKVEDLETDEGAFHPEFTNQLFGDNENIFGYIGLKIKILYTSSTLHRFISITYDEKISPEITDGVEADDVLAILKEKIPGEFTSNIDVFSKKLTEENSMKPIGEKLTEFTINDGKERRFEIYRATAQDPGFTSYHERMQTWILWFIDGASYIEIDDDKWEFFTMFEKPIGVTNGGGTTNGNSHNWYNFVGYATIYRYWVYMASIRPRISQVLILPPFQRKGLGAHLLETIYENYRALNEVKDISVEDPSDDFVGLRDYVDCKQCRKLPCFTKEKLLAGWSPEMLAEAQTVLKLNKMQTRRVYEILKLSVIDRNNPEMYKKYRLEVKNRLNAPFLKITKGQEKVVDSALAGGKELRMEQLKQMYQDVEDEYTQTIEKLESCA